MVVDVSLESILWLCPKIMPVTNDPHCVTCSDIFVAKANSPFRRKCSLHDSLI